MQLILPQNQVVSRRHNWADKCLISLLLRRTNAESLLGRPPVAPQPPATTTYFDGRSAHPSRIEARYCRGIRGIEIRNCLASF
jgi:hypothetical protein